MTSKTIFGFIIYSILLTQIAGCSFSSSGTLYRNAKPTGEEYELTGVVNGLWKYDATQNKSRLEELLPEGSRTDIDRASQSYQVRVGFKQGMFDASASEVVILPEGWTYTTESSVEGDNVVNIGDVVLVRAQKNRQVDYLTKIVRKCNQSPIEGEKPEWDIGCQSIAEFDENGYGGNKYFWTGF